MFLFSSFSKREIFSFSVGVNGNIYVTAANKKTVQKAYAPVVILSIDNAVGIKEGYNLNKVTAFLLSAISLSACNSVYMKPDTLDASQVFYADRGGYTMRRAIKEQMENIIFRFLNFCI